MRVKNSAKRFGFLFAIAVSTSVEATDFTHLETRHGKIDAIAGSDTTSIQYRGKVLLALAAESASLFRVTSNADHEYVIVSAWHPGLNCHHFFHLIELSSDGTAFASKEFGECYELDSAGFVSGRPVVHLKSPAIPDKPVEKVSYLWLGGTMRKILEPVEGCRAPGFFTKTQAVDVSANKAEGQVIGAGKLQFFSAPSDTCMKKGVFVVPGDTLVSSLMYKKFAFVTYTNPKTGNQTDGWVNRERLAIKNK